MNPINENLSDLQSRPSEQLKSGIESYSDLNSINVIDDDQTKNAS
jgi:hypothetical protein